MVKLKIGPQVSWPEHRSGWKYVVKCLHIFDHPEGLLFDGVMDLSFGYPQLSRKAGIPYREPWIGFLHSTVTVCPFLPHVATLETILQQPLFLESLPHCKGIFTLSLHAALFIRDKLKRAVPVEGIKHPAETTDRLFDMNHFLQKKRLLHAGNWLRRCSSFLHVKIPEGWEKMMLMNPSTASYLAGELIFNGQDESVLSTINQVQHVPDSMYDELLAESVVFLDLCDSNATNTIIECILRNTPVLVNRIPAVEEYLGADYPFYFQSLEEAESKLQDMDLVKETTEYLSSFPGRMELTGEYFVQSFSESGIIRGLE